MAYDLVDVAGGLHFPEGPVALGDGSVLVTEIASGTLSRVESTGTVTVVATLGGGPNGAAIGPDGLVYVCNNGGSMFHERDGLVHPGTPTQAINQGAHYDGGRLERVDLTTGSVEVAFREVDSVRLCAANDIVFDHSGGFWMSDTGKSRPRDRDRAGVIYARPSADDPFGYRPQEVLFPVEGANGVGLAPGGDVLYVAETYAARLRAWDLDGPGRIAPGIDGSSNRGRILFALTNGSTFDSLAVDSEGNVAVATVGFGGISVFAPNGTLLEFIETGDPYTTNICFGGDDLRTAYVTCAGTGRLVRVMWPVPGLPLAFGGTGSSVPRQC